MFAFATSSSQTSGKAVVGGGAMVEPRVCGSAMPWVSSLTCSMDLSERLPRSPGAFASWGLRRGAHRACSGGSASVLVAGAWSGRTRREPGETRRRWTADARRGGANGELKLLYVGSHSSHDDPVGDRFRAARLTGNDTRRTVSSPSLEMKRSDTQSSLGSYRLYAVPGFVDVRSSSPASCVSALYDASIVIEAKLRG